jgi:hypothetical protein
MKVGDEESDHVSRNGGSFFKAFFLKSSSLMYLHNQGVRPIVAHLSMKSARNTMGTREILE